MALTGLLRSLLEPLRGTPLHPQWLSDRYHLRSRRAVLPGLPGHLALDVGSGNADTARWLRPDMRLVRLDYPATNSHYLQRPDVFATALALPFADAAFDVVLCLEVLEHINADAPAMAQLQRVLRPGGCLVLSVPFIYPEHDAPHDFRRYTRYGISELVQASGLRLRELHQHGNSLVVSLHMVNLALLEGLRCLAARSVVLMLAAALPVVALVLGINLLAALVLGLRRPDAAAFGWFVIADKPLPAEPAR